MIANDLLSLLRHPLTGEELVGDFPAEDHGGCAGLTGMLRSASGEFPVIGGVVIFRADLATDKTVAGQARVRALELLGKDLGLFIDRKEQRTHVVIERRTPRLNDGEQSPEMAARLAAAMDVIEAEATALP